MNPHHTFPLSLIHIYTPAGDAGKRLSGGEKQRIAIARAILKNAPIVILLSLIHISFQIMQEPPLFNVEYFYVHTHTQAITPRKDSKSKVIVYCLLYTSYFAEH